MDGSEEWRQVMLKGVGAELGTCCRLAVFFFKKDWKSVKLWAWSPVRGPRVERMAVLTKWSVLVRSSLTLYPASSSMPAIFPRSKRACPSCLAEGRSEQGEEQQTQFKPQITQIATLSPDLARRKKAVPGSLHLMKPVRLYACSIGCSDVALNPEGGKQMRQRFAVILLIPLRSASLPGGQVSPGLHGLFVPSILEHWCDAIPGGCCHSQPGNSPGPAITLATLQLTGVP